MKIKFYATLRQHNGRDTSFLENGLDTTLSSEDRLSLFPAVGGGRADNPFPVT
jgi:molybdopterin converting factor small subunit